MAAKCVRCKQPELLPMTFVDPLGWMHEDCATSHRDAQSQSSSMNRRNAQWSDKDAVVVFLKPDGTYSYPARNDKATPSGCERVEIKSLRELERFERKANVRSEVAWYDRGSGNSAEHDVPNRRMSERERFAIFERAWSN